MSRARRRADVAQWMAFTYCIVVMAIGAITHVTTVMRWLVVASGAIMCIWVEHTGNLLKREMRREQD